MTSPAEAPPAGESPPAVGLARVVRLAAKLLSAPGAFLTYVGDPRAFGYGLAPTPETRVGVAERVLAEGELMLPGGSEFEGMALLAVPVRAGDGAVRGVLAVIDRRDRGWTEAQRGALRDLADFAQAHEDLCASAGRWLAEARSAVREEEKQYRRLVELSPSPTLIQRDGRIVFANGAFLALVGAGAPEAVTGSSVTAFLDLPYLRWVHDVIVGARAESAPTGVVEESLRRPDGGVVPVQVVAVPYVYEGRPAVQISLHDVSARNAAQAALRESTARLLRLLDQTSGVLWATDAGFEITSVLGGSGNALASRLRDTDGRGVGGVVDAATAPELVAAHRRALAGESATVSVIWGGRTFEVRVDPLRDAQDATVGTVGIAIDVTDRAVAEEAARDALQLEGLTRVAGGVAHEMNNLLATIMGLASVLEGAPLPPGARRDVRAIAAASRRGRELVGNLLGFARAGRYRRERLVLNELANDAAAWARAGARGTQVEGVLDPGVPAVEGDPEQIRDAIRNLCSNALEAMPQGGRLEIRTRSARVEAGPPLDLQAGLYAVVDVRDTGVGMTEEVRRRAPEPFFTTKPPGRGPGLGLSMAWGVARNHGGTLHIESAPGAGTLVSVYLPASLVATQAQSAVPPAETRGRVLVVDDDEWVRYSSGKMLENMGYEVVEAEDGARALQRFRAGEFDFVLLDLRMPGMSGEEVLRRLIAAEAGVRVLICTGYERDQVSRGLFEMGRVGFLGKPFTTEELASQLVALGVAVSR